MNKIIYAYVLSRFRRVRFFATQWAAIYQAPLSMGFSRQESWSGLPCPPAGRFFTTSATWEAPDHQRFHVIYSIDLTVFFKNLPGDFPVGIPISWIAGLHYLLHIHALIFAQDCFSFIFIACSRLDPLKWDLNLVFRFLPHIIRGFFSFSWKVLAWFSCKNSVKRSCPLLFIFNSFLFFRLASQLTGS